MYRLPTSITIAGKRWRVIVDPRLTEHVRDVRTRARFSMDGEKTLAGLTDARTRTIHIAARLNARDRWAVFCHELLHALIPCGLVSNRLEEEIVQAVTFRLMDVVPQLRRLRRPV